MMIAPPSETQVYYLVRTAEGFVQYAAHTTPDVWEVLEAQPDHVRITSEQFDTISRSPVRHVFQDGVLDPAPIVRPGPTLEEAKASAATLIDGLAEAQRQAFLTRGAGQAMEYQATQADALRATAASDPLEAADYPWLAAELSALASVGQDATLRQVAGRVLQQMADWVSVGAAIKEVRRSAKLQVDAAADVAAVAAIVAAVRWPGEPST